MSGAERFGHKRKIDIIRPNARPEERTTQRRPGESEEAYIRRTQYEPVIAAKAPVLRPRPAERAAEPQPARPASGGDARALQERLAREHARAPQPPAAYERYEDEERGVPAPEAGAEDEQMTRRKAIAGVLATSAATYGIGKWADMRIREHERHRKHRRHRIAQDDVEPQQFSVEAKEGEKPERFRTGILAGQKVASLTAMYLGVNRGTLPEHLDIDFSTVLQSLWHYKSERWKGKETMNSIVVGGHRMTEYMQAWRNSPDLKDKDGNPYPSRDAALERMTLMQASDKIEGVVKEMQDGIDANAYKSIYQLDENELRAAGALAMRIDGDAMLAAYSLTELLPSWNGDFNADYYDFMLRSAGARFLLAVPSLGDSVASFGPLQLTPFAFMDTTTEAGKHVRHGASKVNMALSKQLRLPGDIDQLTSYFDHFKAGYLFALNNIAHLAGKLHEPQLTRFRNLTKKDLLVFMATSHNNPSLSERAMRQYLSQDPTHHRRSLIQCCEDIDDINFKKKSAGKSPAEIDRMIFVRIADYGKKTLANYDGIRKFRARHGGAVSSN